MKNKLKNLKTISLVLVLSVITGCISIAAPKTKIKPPKLTIKNVTVNKNVITSNIKISKDVKSIVVKVDGKKIKTFKVKNKTKFKFSISPVLTARKHRLTVIAKNKKKSTTKYKTFMYTYRNPKLVYAKKATTIPVLDGISDDECWKQGDWYNIDQNWYPDSMAPDDADDFSGRYKYCWDENYFYFLAEVTDDYFTDKETKQNFDNSYDDSNFPFVSLNGGYHNFDVLELFLDEDASGGDHTFDTNAFAFHMTTELHTFDVTYNWAVISYDRICQFKWTKSGENTYTWEGAIKVFDDRFDAALQNIRKPVKLYEGKILGVSLAYCDNDWKKDSLSSPERDHFMASNSFAKKYCDYTVSPESTEYKNVAYKNASVFGKVILEK